MAQRLRFIQPPILSEASQRSIHGRMGKFPARMDVWECRILLSFGWAAKQASHGARSCSCLCVKLWRRFRKEADILVRGSASTTFTATRRGIEAVFARYGGNRRNDQVKHTQPRTMKSPSANEGHPLKMGRFSDQFLRHTHVLVGDPSKIVRASDQLCCKSTWNLKPEKRRSDCQRDIETN